MSHERATRRSAREHAQSPDPDARAAAMQAACLLDAIADPSRADWHRWYAGEFGRQLIR